jgi:hypothetical protein
MAASYVNFDVIKARVSMEDLIRHYGLLSNGAVRKGNELILSCLFHENDSTPSLKINTAKKHLPLFWL